MNYSNIDYVNDKVVFQSVWPAFLDFDNSLQIIDGRAHYNMYPRNMIAGQLLFKSGHELSMTGTTRISPSIERYLFQDRLQECQQCYGGKENPWDNPSFQPNNHFNWRYIGDEVFSDFY